MRKNGVVRPLHFRRLQPPRTSRIDSQVGGKFFCSPVELIPLAQDICPDDEEHFHFPWVCEYHCRSTGVWDIHDIHHG